MLELYDLKTEYRAFPMGVDTRSPRLSWKLRSDRRGVVQTTYHIVAKSDGTVIWDSGIVESADSQRICYKGKALESRQTVSWTVEITANDENGREEIATSPVASFQMGMLAQSDWTAHWIACENETDSEIRKPVIYLRKEFVVRNGLKKALIFQSAHGLYDFTINGQMGTKDKFLPGLTSYYHRIQYQMYDVTELLVLGTNCWGVRLADGWWRGVTGGSVRNNFGRELAFFGQMELVYEDGSRETIVSDEDFRWSTGGLLASDMLMGDIYDAALEPKDWNRSGFNDKEWKKTYCTSLHTEGELIASRSVPVREMERFRPVEFTDSRGKRVLDFGQNIAGYVKAVFRNTQPGQTIHLFHGEELVDGAFSQDNVKKTVLPVSEFQEVIYHCKGGTEEIYCPAFAVFGFRYVLIEGYSEAVDGFEAIAVYSEMEETGDFSCSHPLINQLVKNSRWSQKGNFLDVAVDCPTRERNAWTGDNQVYVKTAADFMDVYLFYEKWLADQAVEQFSSGKVGITFPSTSSVHDPGALADNLQYNSLAALAGPEGDGNIGEDAVGWGDSAVWLPYVIYLCYGDIKILKQQYTTARKWLEYELSQARNHNPKYEHLPQYKNVGLDGVLDGEFIYDTNFQYGEWNEPIDKTPQEQKAFLDLLARAQAEGKTIVELMAEDGKPEVATAYMYRSACVVAHMAAILGKTEDAEKYREVAKRIKEVYCTYMIDGNGVIQSGHQAPYVRALQFGLYKNEHQKEQLLQCLEHEIECNNYRLNTGFLSTPFLLPVLADNGQTHLAYRLLEQEESPSWLYTVKKGATTIPESWFAIDRHGESLNHYSYGSVCDFLFSYTAGIQPLFDCPGYRKFVLRPIPGGSLTHAEATYKSPYGLIVSEWKIQGRNFYYRCTIPANTTACLTLPDASKHVIGSGSYEFTCTM